MEKEDFWGQERQSNGCLQLVHTSVKNNNAHIHGKTQKRSKYKQSINMQTVVFFMQKPNAQKDPKKRQQNVVAMQFKCSILKLTSKQVRQAKKQEVKRQKTSKNEEMSRTRTCKYQKSVKLE